MRIRYQLIGNNSAIFLEGLPEEGGLIPPPIIKMFRPGIGFIEYIYTGEVD